MEHLTQPRTGEGQGVDPANSYGVNDGWRTPTPALAHAETLAQQGTMCEVSKGRCIVAVKRVGAALGLKAGDLLLLDTLAAFSQPQDWGRGQQAIVWPSNAYLMERTGFALSTVKRHARKLVNAGLLAFRDSPNGKRWGFRDKTGHIVEGYGYDLSPIAAQVDALEDLAEQVAQQRVERQTLARRITCARRQIRAILGSDVGPHTADFANLLKQLPKRQTNMEEMHAIADAFDELLNEVTSDKTRAYSPKQAIVTPMRAENDPHIQTTNQITNLICTEIPNGTTPKPNTIAEQKIDLETVHKACPEFSTWAKHIGGYIRNWQDLVCVAGQLAPMIGITSTAWETAQRHIGSTTAATCVALIFEKVQTGEVIYPNKYLAGMVRKAESSALNLHNSFYGRIKRLTAQEHTSMHST